MVAGQPRQGQHEPITPMRAGQPPTWVVACLDCGFSVDEYGQTAEDALQSVAPRHEASHALIARPVDYTTGYGEHKDEPHPLYHH